MDVTIYGCFNHIDDYEYCSVSTLLSYDNVRTAVNQFYAEIDKQGRLENFISVFEGQYAMQVGIQILEGETDFIIGEMSSRDGGYPVSCRYINDMDEWKSEERSWFTIGELYWDVETDGELDLEIFQDAIAAGEIDIHLSFESNEISFEDHFGYSV